MLKAEPSLVLREEQLQVACSSSRHESKKTSNAVMLEAEPSLVLREEQLQVVSSEKLQAQE
jgi:hypothetical protein